MQIFNYNIDAFIDKINYYVTYIIAFLKYIFNNIIAIKNVNFSLLNIPNSLGIIGRFLLAIFCIAIFITILGFLDSIFSIIKTIIKWIIKIILLPFKFICWLIAKIIIFFIPKQPPVEPVVEQPIKPNNELKQLNKKISDLEYKLNLQKKQNLIKKVGFRYEKK